MNTHEKNTLVWKEGLAQEDKEAVFEDLFMHVVEAWFSADIACCDECHDAYISEWPYAYSAEEAKFQRNSIDLRTLYSGSRLSEWYTKEEYEQLLPSVKCPNCGQPLSGNIWPYELPFKPPRDYEIILTQIARRASETPFLLLEHPFCSKVRTAISYVCKKTAIFRSDDLFFRGRSLPTNSSPSLGDFDFPPSEFVKERRYNHAGDPVLYLASSEEVCRAELRDANDLFIAKFRLPVSMKVLDLMSPHEAESEHSDMLSFIAYSALLSAKSQDKGFSRPEYVFSRLVKDCAKSSGFDAIRYGSTRVGSARFNLVVINQELTLAKHATESVILRAEPASDRE
jgi:hypothetical protein